MVGWCSLIPFRRNAEWIGSLGYALPFMIWGIDNAKLKDLGSLAAIVAELWGGTAGWDEQLVYCMANLHNGRFRCRSSKLMQVLDRMAAGTAALPSPVRSWILDVGQGILNSFTVADAAPRRDPECVVCSWRRWPRCQGRLSLRTGEK